MTPSGRNLEQNPAQTITKYWSYNNRVGTQRISADMKQEQAGDARTFVIPLQIPENLHEYDLKCVKSNQK